LYTSHFTYITVANPYRSETTTGNNREYFDEMNTILGTTTTSAPVVPVHSGTEDASQVPSNILNG